MSVMNASHDPLVLATSAVDLDTDKAIQEIIRGPDFSDVTLLTIACVFGFTFTRSRVFGTCVLKLSLQPPFEYHYRLRPYLSLGCRKGKLTACQPTGRRFHSATPISDDAPHPSQVVEFDSPKALLDKKDSKFYGLALEAGLA